MKPTLIAFILALVCMLMGGYMVLDAEILCSRRVLDRLDDAHETADRFMKLPGGAELAEHSGRSGGKNFYSMLHELAEGDRTMNLTIGCILLLAGFSGILGLRSSRRTPPNGTH